MNYLYTAGGGGDYLKWLRNSLIKSIFQIQNCLRASTECNSWSDQTHTSGDSKVVPVDTSHGTSGLPWSPCRRFTSGNSTRGTREVKSRAMDCCVRRVAPPSSSPKQKKNAAQLPTCTNLQAPSRANPRKLESSLPPTSALSLSHTTPASVTNFLSPLSPLSFNLPLPSLRLQDSSQS